MQTLIFILLLLGICLQHVNAQSWYFVRYYTPSTAVQVTSFSGTMLVPAAPSPNLGTPYAWPGLQDINTTGVFQSVLDGRPTNPNYIANQWYMATGWCCANPDLPWGPGGFHAVKGDSIQFAYTRTSTAWNTALTLNGRSETLVKDSFPLEGKSFDQVLFAVELYDQVWNFGSVRFRDVVVTTDSVDTKWCTSVPENYNSSTNVTIGKVTTSVDTVKKTMTCYIEEVNLWGPK